MTFNYSKLKGIMREKNFTQKGLADAIGVNECTLNLKLQCKRFFTAEEMFNIMLALEIPESQMSTYFFAH